ncbi:MAG TPA: RNA polymerase sigma factor [Solirubrobacteraceae bacterium]|nr:RNA polymerase sigma factor [Solirubrobacteraceae bacterium]
MEAHSARDDAELWRAADADPAAFGELYERHVRSVFGFCARRTGELALAEDLTSVVFLEAWRKRRSVHLHGTSALPWLLGTANNVMRNQRRSLRRHRTALRRLSVNEAAPNEEEEVIARVDAQRQLSAALRAIDGLPQEQQDAVNLVLWSGLSYEDAAQALGVPVGTVRSRIGRARATLSASLAAPLPATTKESS